MKRFLVLFFAAILSTGAAYAQSFICIKGKVADNKSADAIPHASINFKGTCISTVSNAEGFFTLNIPAGASSDSIISISCPGYVSSEYPVSEFSGLGPDMYLRIPMLPFNMTLDSAIADAVNAEDLLNAAYAMTSKNYASETVGMTAFYREIVKKGKSKHIIIDEVALDIEKSSYADDTPDKVSIRKGRGNTSLKEDDVLFSQYRGGLAAILSLDMVKNPFIGTTLPSATHFYDFAIVGTTSIDGKTFHVVGFKPKEGTVPFLFTGKVYIEEETLAIGRIEFSMDIGDNKEGAAGEFIPKRPADTEFSMTRADYMVNFKEFDGLWYLDYCKADIGLSARRKKSLSKSNYSISSEMTVTDHKEGDFHVADDQKSKYRNMLSGSIESFQDENYWKGYNIIEPELSVENAVRNIVTRLRQDGR